MAETLISWANFCKTGTITAGNSEPALGPTNLSLDQCSAATGWQTQNGVLTAAAGATLRITAPSQGSIWRVVGLFRTNLTPQSSMSVILWSGTTSVWVGTMQGPQVGYGQSIVVMDQSYSGDYLTIGFNDPTNPDNHINIGGAFAGPAWFPQSGITWDSSYTSEDQQDASTSRGGSEYISLLYSRRVWNLALDAVRDSEAGADLGELRRIAALGINILFIPSVLSGDVYREAVFGTVKSTADVTFPHKLMDARAWRGQIKERL
jgi:hypothetical protein